MLDVGWSELLLIGVVALIVVGPKDLPHLFQSLGRFTAKARSMAREFSTAMEDAARNSGVDDAAKSLRDVKSLTSKKALGLDALDRAAERFEKWDPKLPDIKRRDPLPDPSAPTAPAETAASPTGPTSATPAAAPVTAQAPVVETAASAPAGGRRLHAVRRSDRKDD